MEIKRDLEKLAKRMSNHIEVMNVATEIKQHLRRIDELVTYAQEKIDRAEERKRTLGAKADEARKKQDKIVADAQKEESDTNQADQEEAFEERNQKPGGEVVEPHPSLAPDTTESEDGPETEKTAAASAAQRKKTKKKK